MLEYGVDRIGEYSGLLRGRAALVTSPTGRSSSGRSTVQVLRECCDLRLLLAPEHGLRGDRAAGEEFGSERDPETGLEILSLYSGPSRRLPAQAFDKVDTIVYDIQDVGCRYYTFISTLKYLIQDCTAHGVRLVVLDRPDPLGSRTEGMLLRADAMSFVGSAQIPVVYGLTCGEFAEMIRREENPDCDLQVVPCSGWNRNSTFPDWGREWIPPSPNIPRFETALIYPGTCLLEGTNVSEGRGTADPFFLMGAPWIDGPGFCAAFLALGLPGIDAEPAVFTPRCSKYSGEQCSGIHLHITDDRKLQPVELGIRLICLLRQLYPNRLQLNAGEGMPFLSQLAGHRGFEGETWNAEAWIDTGRIESQRFAERAKQYYLY